MAHPQLSSTTTGPTALAPLLPFRELAVDRYKEQRIEVRSVIIEDTKKDLSKPIS